MSSTHIEIARLPEAIDEFVTLRDELAQTPEGGAAVMIVGLLLYAQDTALGSTCLAAAVEPSRVRQGSGGDWELLPRAMNLIRMQIGSRPHTARSYIMGAEPTNGYALPETPYKIRVSRNPYSGEEASGRVKVFVTSSGADSPRPVTLVRDDQGIWLATEWSSLLSGVRAPMA